MPFYEFRCASCDHTFEELLRSSKDKPAACPACGHGETSRLLSTFSVGAATSGGSSSAPSGGMGPCGRPIGGGCGGGGGACGL